MHGYVDANGESIIQSFNNFKNALVAGGAGNKPIWDTEWSWWPDNPPPQDVQAAFLSTSLILQSALGVQRELYYAYDSIDHGIYNQTTGALTQAGVAFQTTTEWLLGATMVAGCQVSGTTYSVPLLEGGQSTQIVWNSAGNSTYAAGSFTQYKDLTGAIHNIVGGQVTIGEQPILLMTPLTSAPVAPTIASFSTDSGTVGDGITNDNTLTLTGSAEANATVKVYDGATLLGSATANGSGAWSYHHGRAHQRRPQPDRHRHRCGRQYQCGVSRRSASPSTPAPRSPRPLPRSRPTAARWATASPMTIP